MRQRVLFNALCHRLREPVNVRAERCCHVLAARRIGPIERGPGKECTHHIITGAGAQHLSCLNDRPSEGKQRRTLETFGSDYALPVSRVSRRRQRAAVVLSIPREPSRFRFSIDGKGLVCELL